MAKWAVTGATGLVGNNLVRTLLERGDEVSVLVRGSDRRELADLVLQVVPGDLSDPEALKTCFAGADVVAHVAASVDQGYTHVDRLERVNVEGTRSVCAALPEGARLVQVSSVSALKYGRLDLNRTAGRSRGDLKRLS